MSTDEASPREINDAAPDVVTAASERHPMPPSSPALRDLPIGVFDSGVGGLTVAAALRRRLPRERLVYLGDIARLPYGSKSPETVLRYALQAGAHLAGRGIKMLVVACNTASAHALGALTRAHAPLPVLGVVEAGATAAAEASSSGGIVVIATEGTCRSGAFPRAIAARRPDARVSQTPCPLFVAFAEEGMIQGPIAEALVRHYLGDALTPASGNDTLLLGCTHFPLLVPALRAVLGDSPRLVNCGEAVAAEAAATLAAMDLEAPADFRGGISLVTTDAPARFARLAARLLPELGDHADAELIDL